MPNLLDQIKTLLCFNPYCGWLIILLIAFIAAFVIALLSSFIAEKLKVLENKSTVLLNAISIQILINLKFFVLFFWFFGFLSKFLNPNDFISKIIQVCLVFATAYQFSIWGLSLLKKWQAAILSQKIYQNPASSAALGLLYRAIQTVFLLLVLLISLSNLNVNIGALLTGLGIGGIAVALAAQNILVDLLASLSIVLDKPFCVGDLISTGNEKGVVEQIGIKTTRLRSVSGEQLVISNKNLLESRIQNFKRMTQKRVLQTFCVVYSTDPELLKNIPIWVKNIVDQRPNVKFDHCHLMTYGESGLLYELVFFVLSQDSNIYLNTQQDILLEILIKLRSEQVSISFPTRTVYLEK